MIVPVVWACLIALQLAITFAFDADTTTRLLFTWLIAGSLLVSLLAAGRGRRPRASRFSSAGLLLALAIVALVLGAELGTWLLLIGAGMAVLAVARLVTE